jgi:hypothetical protein
VQRHSAPAKAGHSSLQLATAVFAAITFLTVIHRAILAALLARWLVRRQHARTNRSRQNREENFSVTFHTALIFSSGRQTPAKKHAVLTLVFNFSDS